MKARVKATGEIIEVHMSAVVLDENSDSDDYWTRLEHQAAIAAMQAYIIASNISQFSFCEGDMKDCKSMAHALVKKLKEKEERK